MFRMSRNREIRPCHHPKKVTTVILMILLEVFSLEKDDRLADNAKGIPKMPSSALRIFKLKANMIPEEVRKRYKNVDSARFFWKSDGTRDRWND